MPSMKKPSPRNSVNDRPAPWRLLLRRQRKLIWPAACVVAVIALIGTVAWTVQAAKSSATLATMRERLGQATAASGLRVADIRIEGRANTPEPLLRAAIGVSRGDPILGFSVEQARARIETLSWVEHATVERRLPGTIVVYLQERRPFAVWQVQGRFVLVDRAGQTVNQDVSKFRELPLIVGPGAPAAAAVLLDALTERPTVKEKVAAAVRVGERRWNLHMANGTDVMLPEGHEAAALDRLAALQAQQALLDRPLAAIDLRLPDRLVIKPRGEAAKDGPKEGPKEGSAQPPSAPAVPVLARKPT
jgi:cell division protein FtsQ